MLPLQKSQHVLARQLMLWQVMPWLLLLPCIYLTLCMLRTCHPLSLCLALLPRRFQLLRLSCPPCTLLLRLGRSPGTFVMLLQLLCFSAALLLCRLQQMCLPLFPHGLLLLLQLLCLCPALPPGLLHLLGIALSSGCLLLLVEPLYLCPAFCLCSLQLLPAPLTIQWLLPFCRQQCAQPLYFILIFPEHGVLGVLIDAWLVLNVFGAVGIAQRGYCLLTVVVGGSHVCNHHCLSVTTQRVLQQPSELGVAVRDVAGFGIDKRTNDIAERSEGQVDLNALF
mmetsp:Transcript_25497/g.65616  ORF Transcript_25497/g.65616 Transcript_25497/m.65616 type:complete len:280 (+) Transcript_25497:1354-2193(+)